MKIIISQIVYLINKFTHYLNNNYKKNKINNNKYKILIK